jgi:D-sedoheptulose 7-phosphate isomerase
VTDAASLVIETLRDSAALHERSTSASAEATVAASGAMIACLGNGGKILVFGNGGSASDAQHFAAELVGRFTRERRALASIALTTDTSILTALSNDYAFDRVFARQVEALGRPGDVALGISTSGQSANVLAAFAAARSLGLSVVALTGRDGGEVGRAADIHINVPSPSTARVQEVHRTLLHAICELIERECHA